MTVHLPPSFEEALPALLELAEEDTVAAPVARILADVLGDLGATSRADLETLTPAHRIDLVADRLEEVAARLLALELALTETNRRVPAPEKTPGEKMTLFGIPVAVPDGVTVDQIREAVASAPKGLSGKQVAEHLAAAGLVREVT